MSSGGSGFNSFTASSGVAFSHASFPQAANSKWFATGHLDPPTHGATRFPVRFIKDFC